MSWRRAAQAAFWIGLAIIVVGSLTPRVPLPATFSLSDKVVHFGGYAALGLTGALGWPRHAPALLIFAPLFGLALELGQIPVPGRGFDWLDALANAAGALCGVLAARLIGPRLLARRA